VLQELQGGPGGGVTYLLQGKKTAGLWDLSNHFA
jgi:hypothetical protein